MSQVHETSDTGLTLDYFAYKDGQVWNGSAYENVAEANIATYRIAATELDVSGVYEADLPDDATFYELREQAATFADSTVRANGSVQAVIPTIVDLVWDEELTGATHNVPTSAGRRLRSITGNVIREATAQAGSDNSITLDASASAVDGLYDPSIVQIVGGTGIGQARLIIDYNATSKVATVDRDWRVNPDNTSEFVLLAASSPVHINEGLIQAATATTATLNADASATDDVYVGQTLWLKSGTGQDQSRIVTDYNGTTKVATVDRAWETTPDATSGYVMTPWGTDGNTLQGVPAAILDEANGVETGWTLRKALRVMFSALAGKSSGHDSNAPVYRDVADSKDRITATTTTDGRTSVTLDGD